MMDNERHEARDKENLEGWALQHLRGEGGRWKQEHRDPAIDEIRDYNDEMRAWYERIARTRKRLQRHAVPERELEALYDSWEVASRTPEELISLMGQEEQAAREDVGDMWGDPGYSAALDPLTCLDALRDAIFSVLDDARDKEDAPTLPEILEELDYIAHELHRRETLAELAILDQGLKEGEGTNSEGTGKPTK
jgi:hypothetical protein